MSRTNEFKADSTDSNLKVRKMVMSWDHLAEIKRTSRAASDLPFPIMCFEFLYSNSKTVFSWNCYPNLNICTASIPNIAFSYQRIWKQYSMPSMLPNCLEQSRDIPVIYFLEVFSFTRTKTKIKVNDMHITELLQMYQQATCASFLHLYNCV